MKLVSEAIAEYYGEPCSEYLAGCPCCEAWKEYATLLSDSRELAALNAGGVDNWEGYSEALAGFFEDE